MKRVPEKPKFSKWTQEERGSLNSAGAIKDTDWVCEECARVLAESKENTEWTGKRKVRNYINSGLTPGDRRRDCSSLFWLKQTQASSPCPACLPSAVCCVCVSIYISLDICIPVTTSSVYAMYINLYNLLFGYLWFFIFLNLWMQCPLPNFWSFQHYFFKYFFSTFSLLLPRLWWHKCIFCDCPTDSWDCSFFFPNLLSLCCLDWIISIDSSSSSLILSHYLHAPTEPISKF